jgi:DUF4097 and DUF4098 domain-containing protein YvlB
MKVLSRHHVAVLLICAAGAAPATAQVASRDPQERAAAVRAQANRVKAERAVQRRGAAEAPHRPRAAGPEVTEAFSRTVPLTRGGTFELQNIAGDVTVNGAGGNEARIEAMKRARGLTEAGARAFLNTMRIDVVERAGTVEVRTVYPRANPALAAVDYTITLPTGANVVVRSASGRLRIQNVAGEVRAQSFNGDVSAVALKRIRALRSASGNIDVNDSEADEFNVDTLQGNVIIRNFKARVLDLHTVTGNVMLHDVATERALLQSMAGDLEYAGRLMRSGRYQLQTHGGNIRVIPAGSADFDLEAMTVNGDVRSDFVLKMFQRPGGVERQRLQKVLRGTIGDASALLSASSFSGDIVIVKPQ